MSVIAQLDSPRYDCLGGDYGAERMWRFLPAALTARAGAGCALEQKPAGPNEWSLVVIMEETRILPKTEVYHSPFQNLETCPRAVADMRAQANPNVKAHWECRLNCVKESDGKTDCARSEVVMAQQGRKSGVVYGTSLKGTDDMKEPEEPSAQFLKLLDIAERQRRLIDQWQLAEAQGPTDSQLWEAELAKITAELHGLMLKGVTPGQFREFNEALAIKSKGKQDDG